jgi:hypothetical protein
MTRNELMPMIIEALRANGGSAKIYEVCKHVWDKNNSKISAGGKMLYTWQYDIRWAANQLRRQNKIESLPRGFWSLKSKQ